MTDLEGRFRQQQAVVELGQRALASVPLAALLDEASRLVAYTLEIDLVGIFEPDADRRSFALRAGVGWDLTVLGTARLPGGFRSAAGFALLASGPVVSDDLKAETRFDPGPVLTQHGAASGVWVAIEGRAKPHAVLAALARGPRRFDPAELQFLRACAHVLASAVERDRSTRENEELVLRERMARAQAESAHERATFLSNASRVLASSLDYEVTLENVTRLAVPYVADGCIVDVLDQDGAVRRVAVAGLDRAVEELAREVIRRYPPAPDGPHPVMVVIRTGRPIVLSDIPDELLAAATVDAEHLKLARGLGLKSAIVVPIRARDRTLGAVSFVSVRDSRRFTDADLPFAEDLAHRAALAVDNARLYQEAERSRADAESANRAKDDFLAILSHELRTTLTSVLGWGRLLRTGRLSPEARERALDSIDRNASAQVRLIEDLLDVSRIAAGKLELRLGAVEIAGTLAAAIDVVRPDAAAKDVRLDASVADDVGVVRGDAARIEQIVWNLLTNAVKFTDAGGRVALTATREGAQIRIVVSDTGAGIPAELLPYVFDRFRQGRPPGAASSSGLGLGLAIVRDLVKLHGGTVDVQSEGVGRGATFTVRLPIA